MTALDLQVIAGNDDAGSKQDGTAFSATAASEAITANTGLSSARTTVGVRFQNVTIPPSATILTATLEVWVTNAKADDPNLDIRGEAADNAVDFATTASVTTRTLTTASVQWTASNLGTNAFKTSPDVTSVVQEIVNRGGWVSGNALVVLLVGRSDVNQSVQIDMFNAGAGANAAKLHITYVGTWVPQAILL